MNASCLANKQGEPKREEGGGFLLPHGMTMVLDIREELFSFQCLDSEKILDQTNNWMKSASEYLRGISAETESVVCVYTYI